MDIVIIEDEDLAAISLEQLLLKSSFTISIKKRLESVEESINWLKNNTCDLIISDIHLGDGESFEIFETLKIKTPIIFTTAFDEYAIKSFQYFAVDYLLKPYDKEKLNNALQKFISIKKNNNSYPSNLDKLLVKMANKRKKQSKKERFLVSKGNQLLSIKTNEIAYFMAQGKYLFLVTDKGESHLYEDTLTNIENYLSKKDFFKINRQYIVRHSAIKSILRFNKNRIKIELLFPLDTNELILVSANKNSEFKNWLNR